MDRDGIPRKAKKSPLKQNTQARNREEGNDGEVDTTLYLQALTFTENQ